MEDSSDEVVVGEEGSPPSSVTPPARRRGRPPGRRAFLKPRQPSKPEKKESRLMTAEMADRASLDALTAEESRFVELRIIGKNPSEAIRTMDEENKKYRSTGATHAKAHKFENRLKHAISSLRRAEEMPDSQWQAWMREKVTFMVNHPSSSTSSALAALRFLDQQRQKSREGDVTAIWKKIDATCRRMDELTQIMLVGKDKGVEFEGVEDAAKNAGEPK